MAPSLKYFLTLETQSPPQGLVSSKKKEENQFFHAAKRREESWGEVGRGHLEVSSMLSGGVALAMMGGARGGGGGGDGAGGADLDDYICLCFCWCPGEFAGEGDWQRSGGMDGGGGGVFEWGSCNGWDTRDAGSGALTALGEDGHGKEEEGEDWEDEVLHVFGFGLVFFWCGRLEREMGGAKWLEGGIGLFLSCVV